MHILIIHQAFASLEEPGGTRHFELARLLGAHGHRVTIIASPVSYITGARVAGDSNDAPQAPNVVIHRARVYSAHHRSFLHRMLAFTTFMVSSFVLAMRVPAIDVVWGTSPPIFQAVTAWLVARLKGARLVLEVRDLWPYFAVAVGVLRDPVLIRLSEWLERFLYRHADCIMVNSPGFIDHVEARGADRVELVPNGADPEMFAAGDAGTEFRQARGWGGSFVALYAGAHGMSNDLDVVLEAARQLQGEDIRIVFVGDGKEKPALQARAARMGLKNVEFLAPLPKRSIPAAIAAADAGIAILKPIEAYKTTYPNKVFDYMAAARPVLLVIDGVVRKVVEAAECGLYVPPGNAGALAEAVRQLAADRDRARQLGTNGRRYLERHLNRESIAERLLEVLRATVAAGREND